MDTRSYDRCGGTRSTGFSSWVAFSLLVVVPFLMAIDLAWGEPIKATVYRDTNGYFSFLPPPTWKRTDYPGDPRSKVQFTHPTEQDVFIRLIVSAVDPVDTETFVADKRAIYEEVVRRFGAKTAARFERTSFLGFPAVSTLHELGDTVQEQRIALAGSIQLNIVYHAPDHETLDRYRSIVDKSLHSISISKARPSEASVELEDVARYLRQAQLHSLRGDFAWAASVLEEGLRNHPGNQSLERALSNVRRGETIPGAAAR